MAQGIKERLLGPFEFARILGKRPDNLYALGNQLRRGLELLVEAVLPIGEVFEECLDALKAFTYFDLHEVSQYIGMDSRGRRCECTLIHTFRTSVFQRVEAYNPPVFRNLARAGLVLAGFVSVAPAAAQTPAAADVVSRPLEIKAGPSKPGFELKRLNTENYGSFVPFYVTETELLSAALKTGRVAAETAVLVTETAGGKLALLTDQMAYHHLAQGKAGGKDWLATF
jgi:hypothetical protein